MIRVQDPGFGVLGLEFRVQGLRFEVRCLGFRVLGLYSLRDQSRDRGHGHINRSF